MFKMLTLDEVLKNKGEEYAPFDSMRVHRIYAKVANRFGLDTFFSHNCKVIHIIGTNGKGSTGRFITMGLTQNGKKALHFSSPHIFDFNERYFVSTPDYRGNITKEALEKAHQKLWALEAVHEASYFEYATFLALLLAIDYEYLVLEAGVGGEYDSTSVIVANVTVFTLIGLDHEEMLGSNIRDIALTKLRAMSGAAIVSWQREAEVVSLAVELAKVKGIKCDIWKDIDENKCFQDEKYALMAYIHKHKLPKFLQENLYTAMRTLAFFGMKFDFDTLEMLSLRGRCEVLEPNIVLDVGHNIDCARVISEFFGQKSVNLVYNSYIQKDIEGILRILLPIIKKVLIISVSHNRICPRGKLVEILQSLELEYDDFSMQNMNMSEDYLVFGSFSVIETFLRQYKGV